MRTCQHCDKPITPRFTVNGVTRWQDPSKHHSHDLCDGRDNDLRTAPQDFRHRPVAA